MALYWWAMESNFSTFTNPRAPSNPVGKQCAHLKGHTKVCRHEWPQQVQGSQESTSTSLVLYRPAPPFTSSLLDCCPRPTIFPAPLPKHHLIKSPIPREPQSQQNFQLLLNSQKNDVPPQTFLLHRGAQITSPQDAPCALNLPPFPKVTLSPPTTHTFSPSSLRKWEGQH